MSEFSKLYTKVKHRINALEVKLVHPMTCLEDRITLCDQKLQLIEECNDVLNIDITMNAYTIRGFKDALEKQSDAILKQKIKYQHLLDSLNRLIS